MEYNSRGELQGGRWGTPQQREGGYNAPSGLSRYRAYRNMANIYILGKAAFQVDMNNINYKGGTGHSSGSHMGVTYSSFYIYILNIIKNIIYLI